MRHGFKLGQQFLGTAQYVSGGAAFPATLTIEALGARGGLYVQFGSRVVATEVPVSMSVEKLTRMANGEAVAVLVPPHAPTDKYTLVHFTAQGLRTVRKAEPARAEPVLENLPNSVEGARRKLQQIMDSATDVYDRAEAQLKTLDIPATKPLDIAAAMQRLSPARRKAIEAELLATT